MNLVLPILFGAVLMGVFVRRMNALSWSALVLWILAVIVAYWVRN